MDFTKDIIIDRRKQRPRKDRIKYIVLHYPAMPGRSAQKVAKYFKDTNRSVSTHFVVDELQIIQLIDYNMVAYHCGTKGVYLCDARNGNSIGIDLCDNKLNSKHISASDDDWYFKHGTILNAISLVAHLMKEFNVPIENVIRHHDVTGKICPRPFVGDDILTATTIHNNICTGNQYWFWFKACVERRYNYITSIK